jgi:hypothetical protein
MAGARRVAIGTAIRAIKRQVLSRLAMQI